MEERAVVWSRGQDSGSLGGRRGQEIRAAGSKHRGKIAHQGEVGPGRGSVLQKPEFIYEVSLARAKNKPRLYLHDVQRLAE